MKKFPSLDFDKQLSHSRMHSCIFAELSEFEQLVKFAIQHCEDIPDYDLLFNEVVSINRRFTNTIKKSICCEHSENITDSPSNSSDN